MNAKSVACVGMLILLSPNASSARGPNFQQGTKLVGWGVVGSAQQGTSAALDADGNTAIVGASSDNSSAGAALTYTRSNGVWTQLGPKLVGTGAAGAANQGASVALSADGNTAIEGGSADNSGVGAAWVFSHSTGAWVQQGAKLVGTGAAGIGRQGYSVSMSADGNTAIVGGYSDNGGVGAAWVYTRSGGVWSQQGSKLVGSGAVGSSFQGVSVALSADGSTALVGASSDNSNLGAAWVYTVSGGVWSQQGAKLVGTGAVGVSHQGYAVSLSADGNTAMLGGPLDNSFAGAAWMFVRTGGMWTQQGSKLVGNAAVGNSSQGFSVALSADGNTAAVGGYSDNSNAGSVWLYGRGGSAWSQRGVKLVGTGAVGNPSQGYSVGMSGDGYTCVVGGPSDNTNAGAAWVFADPTPTLAAISDVPNDQGGRVNIHWNASLIDNEPSNPMDAYWIWRQVPTSMAQAALAAGGRLVNEGPAPQAGNGRLFRTTRDATRIFYWEYVGSQVADGYTNYSYTATTTSDSVGGSNPYTVFMVEAKQISTGARWPSDPDSGYSVDNLPPAEPAPLGGIYSLGITTLHWRENAEPDLSHYNLYRGASSGFVPGPGSRITSLTDTTYADATPGGHFYKLSAVDVHGNESSFNLLTPQQVGAVPAGGGSGLWLGRATPNPARGTSAVRYSLEIAGPTELSVFDARGALVRHLVHGTQSAGEGQASWDGRGDRGSAVPVGIYFLQLKTAGRSPLTQRLVWIK